MSEQNLHFIDHEGIRFAHVKDYELLLFDDLKQADALIIEFISFTDTFNLLKMVRTHSDRNIYLIPIFLYKAYDLTDKVARSLADGEVNDLKQLDAVMTITQKIIKLAEYG